MLFPELRLDLSKWHKTNRSCNRANCPKNGNPVVQIEPKSNPLNYREVAQFEPKSLALTTPKSLVIVPAVNCRASAEDIDISYVPYT